MFKNDKKIIIVKNIPNLNMWLLLWYNNAPPSVEYIVKLLIIPKTKIQINKVKSSDFTF